MPGVLARPYAKLERFGLLIMLGLVFLVPMAARQLGVDLNVFRWLVGLPSGVSNQNGPLASWSRPLIAASVPRG